MSRQSTFQTGGTGNTTCNCLRGTAVMVNGVCTCENDINPNPPFVPPPMPTTPLPVGYYWFWNGTSWIAKKRDRGDENIRITDGPFSLSSPVTTITNYAKANPLIALAVIGGALYFFKKK